MNFREREYLQKDILGKNMENINAVGHHYRPQIKFSVSCKKIDQVD